MRLVREGGGRKGRRETRLKGMAENLARVSELNICSHSGCKQNRFYRRWIFFYFYLCLGVFGYVPGSVGAYEFQKRALDSLELQLWALVSLLIWVLGTEL